MRYAAFIVSLIFLFGVGFLASYFYPGGFALAQAQAQGRGNIINIILLGLVMLLGIFSSFVFAKAKTAAATSRWG